jgi:hypothetical protein
MFFNLPPMIKKRYIDVTLFGNLSRLLSYHASCGVVSQVRVQS